MMSLLYRLLLGIALITSCAVCLAQQTPAPDANASKTAQKEASASSDLPKLEDFPRPTDEELLNGPKRDWIVIPTNEVFVVEPLEHRPDALEQIQNRLDQLILKQPTSETDRIAWRQDYEDAQFLKLRLLNDREAQLYQMHRDIIKTIIYHEDLMIKRLNVLIDESQLELAREFFYRLKRWDEQRLLKRKQDNLSVQPWPELPRAEVRLKLKEAELLVTQHAPEKAWRILLTIDRSVILPKELDATVERVGQSLLLTGLDEQVPHFARRYYRELKQQFPEHPRLADWRLQLQQRAMNLKEQAVNEVQTPFEKEELLRLAVQWDPEQRAVRDAYLTHARIHPIVNVGLMSTDRIDVMLQGNHSFHGAERLNRLQPTTLFELTSYQQGHPHYKPRFIRDWQPVDLGRETNFLFETHSADVSGADFSGFSVLSKLKQRLSSESEHFDQRLRRELLSWEMSSPFELNLYFRKTPLRQEPVLEPIGMVCASKLMSSRNGLLKELPDVGFELAVANAESKLNLNASSIDCWVKQTPQRNPAARNSLYGLRECFYDSHEELIRDFLRGHLDVIIDPWRPWLADLKDDKRFQQVKLSLPEVHLLLPHPDSNLMNDSLLRKALSLAINRPELLRDTFIDQKTQGLARLTTGPFPQSSYAYDPSVNPVEHNPLTAMAMLTTWKAVNQKSEISIKLKSPAEFQARNACQLIAENLRQYGLNVEQVEFDATQWDLSYECVMMAEPLTEMWTLLSQDPNHRVEDLSHLPDLIRQRLQRIEDSQHWYDASAELRRLHRDLHDLMLLIPLWELDRVALYRTDLGKLLDPGSAPVCAYQNIENWVPEVSLPVTEPLQ